MEYDTWNCRVCDIEFKDKIKFDIHMNVHSEHYAICQLPLKECQQCRVFLGGKPQ